MLPLELFRNILVSVKFSVRNSGARNGYANFMDTWKMPSFCRKTSYVHKIPRFFGGGDLGFFLGGGGKCRFYIYGREGFYLAGKKKT